MIFLNQEAAIEAAAQAVISTKEAHVIWVDNFNRINVTALSHGFIDEKERIKTIWSKEISQNHQVVIDNAELKARYLAVQASIQERINDIDHQAAVKEAQDKILQTINFRNHKQKESETLRIGEAA